jgi:hypothetical protein
MIARRNTSSLSILTRRFRGKVRSSLDRHLTISPVTCPSVSLIRDLYATSATSV